VRIRITNRSQYPAAEVRQLVRRALNDLDITDVHVQIYHRKGESGHTTGRYREYWYPRRKEDRPVIQVGLPKVGVPICDYIPYQRKQSPPEFELRDWREALLAIVAHEGMHHRQTPRNYYRSTREVARTGSQGRARYVEHECDWAAYRAVKRWRDENGDV